MRLTERLARYDPRRVALAAAAATSVLVVVAALEWLGAPLEPFDLDDELTVPAFYSALVLLAAATLAFAFWSLERRAGRSALAPLGLAVLFAFMAVDEVGAIHERLDDWFGLEDWIVGYLPLAALGGIAWLALLRRFRGGARRLWIAGAAAWVVATLLEVPTQEGVQIEYYAMVMFPEEVLEMTGSTCFLLVLLMALRREAMPATPSSSSDGLPPVGELSPDDHGDERGDSRRLTRSVTNARSPGFATRSSATKANR